MNEPAVGGGLLLALGEERESIANAGVAQLFHTHRCFDGFGKGQGGVVAAPGFNDEADGGTGGDIQEASLYQPGIHSRVEEAVVGGGVDVSVDIVVRPAGRAGADYGELASGRSGGGHARCMAEQPWLRQRAGRSSQGPCARSRPHGRGGGAGGRCGGSTA